MTTVLYVDSLGEYFDKIAQIHKEADHLNTLWFRAESRLPFTLTPSLFRSNQPLITDHLQEQYSNFHHAENIRMQHYNAKNYHYFERTPASRIEWLEVMQHHGVFTRTLDWSESSAHSLLFALESFYNNQREIDKSVLTPCVWVLEPQKLNWELMQILGQDTTLQNKLLKGLNIDFAKRYKIKQRTRTLSKLENLKKYMEQKATKHIDYLINLSAITDEVNRIGNRIGTYMADGDAFNPLFYLLSRVYSDGYLLENTKLPPLAVVQPYHSERIKAQHGIFTVSPFCRGMDEKEHASLKTLNINPNSMSFNPIAQKYLHKIILRSPQKIAEELLSNGMCESWIYPEMPIVSGEIEHHGVW